VGKPVLPAINCILAGCIPAAKLKEDSPLEARMMPEKKGGRRDAEGQQ
jgi:hypothetical protein